jgi:hypothetical protein
MQNPLLAGGVVNPEITNPLLGDLGKKTGTEFFQSFIPGLITLAIVIGSIVFFFMLVAGAIQWISSGGDKQAVEGARGRITSALIGIVILLSVFAIAKLIEIFFGITILTLDIGKLIIQ